MIFQEPTTSLNPCFTIGFQLAETLRLHLDLDRKAARARSVELLESVGIPAAASRLDDFPHQLSGGMNQRVMIAMAISCNPRLLIADEPTTALDVTIQAQILDLLRDLQKERGMALVLVTHNMGVVAEMARRVAVMYAGQVMEERGADALFAAPEHPYTAALLAAMPERHTGGTRLATIPGVVPGSSRPAVRLPVRAALRRRDAGVRRAAVAARLARRSRALPLPARRGRARGPDCERRRPCGRRSGGHRAGGRRHDRARRRRARRAPRLRGAPRRVPRARAPDGRRRPVVHRRRGPHARGRRRVRVAASRRWRGWSR